MIWWSGQLADLWILGFAFSPFRIVFSSSPFETGALSSRLVLAYAATSVTWKRKVHTPELKAKVGLEAVRGVKTITEIAQAYGVHARAAGLRRQADYPRHKYLLRLIDRLPLSKRSKPPWTSIPSASNSLA